MLAYILYAVFLLSCVIIVVAVLLQPGKADAGALFTSSVSSTAFGPRGTQTLLAKITIIAAAVFMLTALMLSIGIGGQRSLMEGAGPGAQATPSPAASPANSPQGEASPAATAQQGQGSAAAPAADGNAAGATSNANAAAPAGSPAASPAGDGAPQNR